MDFIILMFGAVVAVVVAAVVAAVKAWRERNNP